MPVATPTSKAFEMPLSPDAATAQQKAVQTGGQGRNLVFWVYGIHFDIFFIYFMCVNRSIDTTLPIRAELLLPGFVDHLGF